MTKSQLKDAIRNIGNNWVSYISILLISMLSIATYMGVSSASVNLENGANDFYKNSNFYDLEVVSTLLLSESDVDAIKGLDSVESVVPFYFTNAGCEHNNEKQNVNILTTADEICVPAIVSGNAPEKDNECMIEDRFAESLSYSVGDTIEFYGSDGEEVPYLKQTSFTISGIFSTPLHIKPAVKDNSYVYVKDTVFDQEKLQGCYMRAYVRVKDRADGNYFSEAYEKKVKNVKAEIEALAADRCTARVEEVRAMYQEEIDKNETLLEESKEKLDTANASLTDAQKEIKDGDDKLSKSSDELKDLKKKLEEGKKTLDSSKKELDAGKAKLNEAKRKLDSAKVELDNKKALLSEAEAELNKYDAEITQNEKKVAQAQSKLDDAKAELDLGKKKLNKGKKELESTFNDVENWKTSTRETMKLVVNKVMELYDTEIDINWSSPVTDVDIKKAKIEEFSITDSYKIDLLTADYDRVVNNFVEMITSSPKYKKDEEKESKVREYLNTLDSNRESFEAGITKYRAMLQKWNKSRDKYVSGLKEYNTNNKKYKKSYSEFKKNKSKVVEARNEWNEQKKTYDEGQAAYNSGYSIYSESLSEYKSYKSKWEEKSKEYQAGLAKLKEGQETYDDYSVKYDEGLKKLSDYKTKFDENKEKYDSGLEQYEEGRKALEEMKSELDKLNNCEWLVSGVEANVGFKHMGMTVVSLQNLGNNFTILFVVLAALIIYATIARIIGEQHKLVGTTKAFGFYVREILSKYMVFGLSGLLVGLILGVIVSFGFQKFALNTFVKNYVLDTPKAKPIPSIMIIVIVAALAITITAVLFATVSLLRQSAVDLLRESSPKGVNGEGVEKSPLTLFTRLILRNVFSDKTRVIVTMASIASCCALVNIGFTMKFNFQKTEEIEYEERILHTLDISYDVDDTVSSLEDVDNIYKKYDLQYADTMSYYSTFKTEKGSEIVDIIVSDMETVQNFYKFTSPKKHDKVTLNKEGVFLKAGYADAYDIKIGDPITILNKRGVEGQAVVAGIYENYTGQKLYMDTEYYKSVFDEEPEFNKCMVKCSDSDKESLKSELEACSYVHSVEDSDADRGEFKAYTKSLNALLVLINFVAILMAAIIISNLTFMYVNQKKVEIIIMRINGYSFGEVRRYLLEESIFTTVLGIILGLLMGSFLGSSIIRSFEKPHLQLHKSINFKAWLMSTLITVIFSLVINFLALRKVKKMQMTDIANNK